MEKDKRKITFLDTTLRDGEQAPGNSLKHGEKLELALMLEKAGIETIETGFPASSKEDFISTQKISKILKTSNFATFSRTKLEDIDLSIQAGGTSEKHILMLVATGSDLHLEKKRKMSRQDGIEEIKKSVIYAREKGIKNVAVGIEDASRADSKYIEELINVAVQSGANQIILADTTGYAMPNDIYDLVKLSKRCISKSIKLSVHCHNDLGLAVINSYYAILAGADEIQGTIGGIGERAGNTSIEQVLALIHYKGKNKKIYSDVNKKNLYPIYEKLSEYIDLEENRTLPIFGKYVFSTSAGIHQQGILNDPKTYEFVLPEDWGRTREFYIDKHSGKSILKDVVEKQNATDIVKDKIDSLYNKYIDNNDRTITYQDLYKKIEQELEGELLNE